MSCVRRPAVLLAVLLSLLALPGTASAATADQIAAELRGSPVYVEPGIDLPVDEDQVRQVVDSSEVPLYVAIVSAGSVQGDDGLSLVRSVGIDLQDTDASILLITDKPALFADHGRGAAARGINARAAADSVRRGSAPTDAAAVTAGVTSFVRILEQQASGRTGGGTGAVPTQRTSDGGDGGGAVLAVLGLGAAGAGAYFFTRNRRRRMGDLESARADVESLYGRLGSDVSLLAPGDDAVARQALADAGERYNATGALLAKADTPGEFAAARRTAVEGLTAARVARERLGLDPGPEIPAPPGTGPQLEARQRVQVGDEEYEGSPTYEPGRGHYYGGGMVGGRMVPGGWYGVPFWETMLMTSVLTGGLGGGLGGGFGGGYERGYEEGLEDAGDLHDDRQLGDVGGGGWGDVSGGGWGGGGDWGGGGGGDWGGGGGGDAGGGGGSW